jgi:DNA-binding LacI/PurR family transcriptional regulator
MRDVAKLAGVSQSTVSRVLSQSPAVRLISPETTEKVLEAARALDYKPNLTARSLRGRKTHMIAVMIADISNPMYHAIVRTVQDIARRQDYDVLIANTDHDYDAEKSFCEAIIRRPVDGVLMVPYHLTAEDIQQLIERTRVPIVMLAWPDYCDGVDSVYGNDDQATYEAIRWLAEEKGHHRIGFAGVSLELPPGRRRYEAFVRAMQDAGLPVNPDYVHKSAFTIESGRKAMRAFLQLPQPPTAVFACNDLMALGALDVANEMGRRVPQDVAIVGFDNIPETVVVRPRLTTIAQHPLEMGREMARILFDRVDGANGARQNIEFPCTLIEREST